MKTVSAITSVIFALSVGATAQAGQVLASNPQSIMDFFFEQGIPAQLGTDSYNDPMIDYRYEGEAYSLFFYGCTDGARCDSVQFKTGHRVGGKVTLDSVNAWNAEYRFGDAYLTDNGDTNLTYDILTGAEGLSTADFSEVFGQWISMVEDFEDHIGWQ
ncbi:YbjN domain-containing protein [Aliiroseovarius subalbicans]|uniref:YbjN domain-containing protein n=1 Tax=Aliiroseovarius subalbicans TaxID=2925840 RepID=UPI001F57F26D|nr:YbjN domain-containing protein [Aliiroseovarius subalbicans]MCI2399759.1 YbjN domain-containing protein [Aliiroseovarius subalbicans]